MEIWERVVRRDKPHLFAVRAAAAAAAILAATGDHADAQQITNQAYAQPVDVQVLPFATLQIVGNNVLHLDIPPAGSTIPASGVDFVVTGNAHATLTAEPDAFMEVGGQYLGKANMGSESVGYKVELRFPKTGTAGSPIQYAALPGYEAGATAPALTVDLAATGMQREGEVHMEADPNWTPSGGIPLPGTYTGNVVLTLTASY